MEQYSGLVIKLQNILHNYRQIKERVNGLAVIAVVKADAYGHGMKEVVKTLETTTDKPIMYAVAKLTEAIELRSQFPDIDILLFQPVDADMVNLLVDNNITGTLAQINVREIADALTPESKVKLHVKVNSGMNRLGVKPEALKTLWTESQSLEGISLKGAYTHLADSDNDDFSYTQIQLARFTQIVTEMRNSGFNLGLVHSSNSGGIWFHDDSHFQAVRPGISLYGYYPSHLKSEFTLKPAMEVHSYVETINTVPPGESVSYAKYFMSKTDMRVATIPLGYADGIPRALSNKLRVKIGDRIFSQIGRITMDRIIVNIEDADIAVGNKVILLGDSLDAWEWSDKIGTIPYEITCSLNCKRMAKFYKI